MLAYIWPMVLAIVSNAFYQICTKSFPEDANPLAGLTVTYLVGAAASFCLYYALNDNANILREYSRLNWTSFVLGVVLVGLEVGFIYTYKAGWQVSTAYIVQSAFIAVILLLIGLLLYHEALTPNKVVGVAVCLIGLYILNK